MGSQKGWYAAKPGLGHWRVEALSGAAAMQKSSFFFRSSRSDQATRKVPWVEGGGLMVSVALALGGWGGCSQSKKPRLRVCVCGGEGGMGSWDTPMPQQAHPHFPFLNRLAFRTAIWLPADSLRLASGPCASACVPAPRLPLSMRLSLRLSPCPSSAPVPAPRLGSMRLVLERLACHTHFGPSQSVLVEKVRRGVAAGAEGPR